MRRLSQSLTNGEKLHFEDRETYDFEHLGDVVRQLGEVHDSTFVLRLDVRPSEPARSEEVGEATGDFRTAGPWAVAPALSAEPTLKIARTRAFPGSSGVTLVPAHYDDLGVPSVGVRSATNYKNVGKKERQEANYDALVKEVAKAKEAYETLEHRFPTAASRK